MERKIYDRQVNKQGMSDRVVDELNPQNQFRREHVDKLMYHEVRIQSKVKCFISNQVINYSVSEA